MATEVAAAYVSLLPSAKGMTRGIQKELDGTFDQAEKKGTASFGSMFGRVTKLAAAAGTAIAGVFGASKVFGGGMSRLMGIEEAQAKLRGLGNDTKSVEIIMDNALASVRGTSFGMAEAATTAAGAVAAGIKPGEQLERMLTTVSNSAAAAGVGMDEMGSIFNKVATVDMAQMDVLNQVSDRGIPVMQALADTLGVTTDEVRKMASAGEIGFAGFEEAMIKASGTVAEEMGGTLRGSISNMNASLGRIGANFLEGVFPKLAPAIQGITSWLGNIEAAAKGAGEWLGDMWERAADAAGSFQRGLSGETLVKDMGSAFHEVGGMVATYIVEPFHVARDAVDSFVRGFEGITLVKDMGSPIHDFARGLGDTFREAGGGFAGFIAVIQTGISEAANWLASGGASELVSGFVEGRAALLDAAVDVFMSIAEALPAVLPEVVMSITDILIPAILGAFETLLPQLSTIITTLLPAIVEALAGLAAGLGAALASALPEIVGTLAELLPMIIETVVGMLPTLIDAAITLFLGLVDGLVIALPALITAVVNAIPVIITALLSALPSLIDGAIRLFLGLISGLTTALPQIVTAVVKAIPQIVQGLVGALPVLVEGAIQLFLGLIEGLALAIPDILVAIVELVPVMAQAIIDNQIAFAEAGAEVLYALISGIGQIVPALISAIGSITMDVVAKLGEPLGQILARGKEWINNLGSGISDAWNSVAEWFGGIGERVSGYLSSAGTWLTGRGREALDGLLGGIEQGWTATVSWLSGLKDRILNAIPNAGEWLKGSGRKLISGFTDGLRGGFDRAVEAVKNGMNRIRDFFPFSPAREGPFSGRGYTSFSGSALIRDFAKAISDEETALRRATERVLSPLQGALAGVQVPAVAVGAGAGLHYEPHIYGHDSREVADHALAGLQQAQREQAVSYRD